MARFYLCVEVFQAPYPEVGCSSATLEVSLSPFVHFRPINPRTYKQTHTPTVVQGGRGW